MDRLARSDLGTFQEVRQFIVQLPPGEAPATFAAQVNELPGCSIAVHATGAQDCMARSPLRRPRRRDRPGGDGQAMRLTTPKGDEAMVLEMVHEPESDARRAAARLPHLAEGS